ncbi:MAG: CDP-alcohol phosphatidyltransferase family protein [Candidatus Aminicenantes bacterium]|nr:CDP-alcohol phosphatidyltransferase family protein [Candidatus Aminicenantes bacterium]
MKATAKEKFWNVPNVLTLIRIALVPVFALMLLQKKVAGALIIIFLAGSTDVLDGLAARAWNQRTRIGTILDPIADKLLLSTAFILLTIRSLGFNRVIPLWLTAVVIGRDILILAGGAAITCIRGPRPFLPTVPGKISTVFQVTTVFWVILSNTVHVTALSGSPLLSTLTSSSVLDGLFLATLIFTVISGTQYILKGIRMAFRQRSE